MPLDGVTAKCLAAELNARLAEARLDRIFQPDGHDIILLFRCGSENLRLILSANPSAPRIHLTSEVRENPSEPPMFCMLLRKHLAGGRLISIVTPDYERIFQLRFSVLNELGDLLEKRLIVEIMGRHSNIILLNQDDRIIDAILHIDQSVSSVREVMPARTYVLPPNQKKLTPQAVQACLDENRPWLGAAVRMMALDKALLETLQGFSPQLCREVIRQAGLDDRQKPALLEPLQQKVLDQALRSMLENILAGRFAPAVYFDSAKATIPTDFHALSLHEYFRQISVGSVSQAMDLYYLERSRQNILQQKKQSMKKSIDSQLEHARKKLLIHEADRLNGENREKYRIYGELILTGINQVWNNSTEFHVVNYFEADQPIINIPLQENLTLSKNAQRYFKLYVKARTRHENALRLAKEDRRDIEWLEALQNALAMASLPEDLAAVKEEISAGGLSCAGHNRRPSGAGASAQNVRNAITQQPGRPGSKTRILQKAAQKSRGTKAKAVPHPTALPPRQYLSSDGLTILVGRNNLQNDQLTLITAQKEDIWLHVQKMPGTHVIIRTNRQPVPERTLLEAAEIAAWFSKAAAALPEYQAFSIGSGSLQKVAVDYCPVSHVRKPAGARPGMVIYDRYQTLIVAPKEPQVQV